MTHLITTESEYEKETQKVVKAKEYGIHICNEDFIHISVEKEELEDPKDYYFDKDYQPTSPPKKQPKRGSM